MSESVDQRGTNKHVVACRVIMDLVLRHCAYGCHPFHVYAVPSPLLVFFRVFTRPREIADFHCHVCLVYSTIPMTLSSGDQPGELCVLLSGYICLVGTRA